MKVATSVFCGSGLPISENHHHLLYLHAVLETLEGMDTFPVQGDYKFSMTLVFGCYH